MLDSSHRLSEEVKKHLKPEEVKMLDNWDIHNGLGPVSKFQAVTQVYAANLIEKSVQSLIESNKTIAASNNRYASAMMWLTGALVFVGIVQIIIQMVQISQRTPNSFEDLAVMPDYTATSRM